MNSESIFLKSKDLHEYCKTNKNKKQNEEISYIYTKSYVLHTVIEEQNSK